MIEHWRPVIDYESLYEVSDQGNVRNKITLRPLKQFKANVNARYLLVSLTCNGVSKSIAVHKLVLEAFVSRRPEQCIARHGSGGPLDNSLRNLEWGTYEQNNGADRERDGTQLLGEKHPNAKLTEESVRLIRALYAAGQESHKTLAQKYNVSTTVILNVLNRKTWKHV
jgi:hypothetical protein